MTGIQEPANYIFRKAIYHQEKFTTNVALVIKKPHQTIGLARLLFFRSDQILLHLLGDLYDLVALDDVTLFDVVEVLDIQTTLHTGADFLYVILEALQAG